MTADLSWAERAAKDPSLRTFIDAEIARAVVDRDAARAEAAHWSRVAAALDAKLRESRSQVERAREANRRRQVNHRRRHQFAPPLIEAPE